MSASLMYWSDVLPKGAPRQLVLVHKITAAVTVESVPLAGTMASLPMFGATSQATIDAFLGTSSEFTAAQFDATALGADAMGLLVNMEGQASDVIMFRSQCFSASGLTTLVTRASAKAGLTDSTLATELALGANGNIALRIDWGNTPDFDGLTAGYIRTEIDWISK